MKYIECNIFFYVVVFEFFNVVKVFIVVFVDFSYVIVILFVFVLIFFVEWNVNIFIIIVIISVWMILWMIVFGFFDVVNICWIGDIDVFYVIVSRILSLNMFFEKEKWKGKM